MRILIAESKTMSGCDEVVSPEMFTAHRPRLDALATSFMADWILRGPQTMGSALKLSPKLTADFMNMAYEFPNKSIGQKALAAYTGVVFRALDYPSLTPGERQWAEGKTDIISSLYGWLRGDDIVKPYRLDFSPRIAPGDVSMSAYWKPLVTPLLNESLSQDGETEVLDLLPADAAKCVDWNKLKKAGVKVTKVDFLVAGEDGELKRPHSTLLKTLRGKLLREIILRRIDSVDELHALSTDTMYAVPDENTPQSEAPRQFCIFHTVKNCSLDERR